MIGYKKSDPAQIFSISDLKTGAERGENRTVGGPQAILEEPSHHRAFIRINQANRDKTCKAGLEEPIVGQRARFEMDYFVGRLTPLPAVARAL